MKKPYLHLQISFHKNYLFTLFSKR
uniref:Uncharacterized protein n=1 Tax=Anguilla anguilla TaxID=7936 RepID=A0A0E9PN37_ANGAN